MIASKPCGSRSSRVEEVSRQEMERIVSVPCGGGARPVICDA